LPKLYGYGVNLEIFGFTIAFFLGKLNTEADKSSRKFKENTEWMLNTNVEEFGRPKIDLFASSENKLMEKYIFWKPKPEALAIHLLLNGKKFFYIYFLLSASLAEY